MNFSFILRRTGSRASRIARRFSCLRGTGLLAKKKWEKWKPTSQTKEKLERRNDIHLYIEPEGIALSSNCEELHISISLCFASDHFDYSCHG